MEAVGDMHKIKKRKEHFGSKTQRGGRTKKKQTGRTQAIKHRQTGRHLDKREKRERNPSQ